MVLPTTSSNSPLVTTKTFKHECLPYENNDSFPIKGRLFFYKTTGHFSRNDGSLFAKRQVTFHKTTGHFSRNDGSLFAKRQVTFHKTTGHFSRNDGSLFAKRRVEPQRKQNDCTDILCNQYAVLYFTNHLILPPYPRVLVFCCHKCHTFLITYYFSVNYRHIENFILISTEKKHIHSLNHI